MVIDLKEIIENKKQTIDFTIWNRAPKIFEFWDVEFTKTDYGHNFICYNLHSDKWSEYFHFNIIEHNDIITTIEIFNPLSEIQSDSKNYRLTKHYKSVVKFYKQFEWLINPDFFELTYQNLFDRKYMFLEEQHYLHNIRGPHYQREIYLKRDIQLQFYASKLFWMKIRIINYTQETIINKITNSLWE